MKKGKARMLCPSIVLPPRRSGRSPVPLLAGPYPAGGRNES